MEPLQQIKKAGAIQDMEKALAEKTKVVEELTEELEDIRATFGTEGVQQVALLSKRVVWSRQFILYPVTTSLLMLVEMLI